MSGDYDVAPDGIAERRRKQEQRDRSLRENGWLMAVFVVVAIWFAIWFGSRISDAYEPRPCPAFSTEAYSIVHDCELEW